jgi:hypothetical protein
MATVTSINTLFQHTSTGKQLQGKEKTMQADPTYTLYERPITEHLTYH